jgi:hypothetical protein
MVAMRAASPHRNDPKPDRGERPVQITLNADASRALAALELASPGTSRAKPMRAGTRLLACTRIPTGSRLS